MRAMKLLGIAFALTWAAIGPAPAAVNNAPNPNSATPGNVRLLYVSATQLQLCPYQGNRLQINVSVYNVPAACVSLTNGSLAASTLYYIYAFVSGNTIALEASGTGHITSATSGVEVKSSDGTRTLVGMAFTNGSAQFADSQASRNVASWFNRKLAALAGGSTSNATTASTTPVELAVAARVDFVEWADDAPSLKVLGNVSVNASGNSWSVAVGLDGVGAGAGAGGYSASANQQGGAASILDTAVSEGHHIVTPMGSVNASTGTFNVAAIGIVRN